jgi:hypothetical protein
MTSWGLARVNSTTNDPMKGTLIPMNKHQRHAFETIRTNRALIQRLAEQEQKSFSQKRKHTIESCYSSIVLHAHKLGLDIPPLGTFYRPDVYVANCTQILCQLEAKYGTNVLELESVRAGSMEGQAQSTP